MDRAPGFPGFTDGPHTGKAGHITRDNDSSESGAVTMALPSLKPKRGSWQKTRAESDFCHCEGREGLGPLTGFPRTWPQALGLFLGGISR